MSKQGTLRGHASDAPHGSANAHDHSNGHLAYLVLQGTQTGKTSNMSLNLHILQMSNIFYCKTDKDIMFLDSASSCGILIQKRLSL